MRFEKTSATEQRRLRKRKVLNESTSAEKRSDPGSAILTTKGGQVKREDIGSELSVEENCKKHVILKKGRKGEGQLTN